MNPEKIHNAMNYLDDDLIAETDALRQGQPVRRGITVRKVIPWAAAAACLALVLGVGSMLPGGMTGGSAPENGAMEMVPAEGVDVLQDEVIYSGAEASIQESKSDYIMQTVSLEDMSIEIPQTWEYELVREDGGGYFIIIRPPYETGCVRVGCWPNFGVCGTGLTEEKTVIAGMDAVIGTYDDNAVWSFISFGNDYVAINEGADAWWGQHGDLLMKCLESLIIE